MGKVGMQVGMTWVRRAWMVLHICVDMKTLSAMSGGYGDAVSPLARPFCHSYRMIYCMVQRFFLERKIL